MTPTDLARVTPDSLEEFQRFLSEPEWANLLERVKDAVSTRQDLRNYILTCDDATLYALSQSGIDAYYPYLTDDETLSLDQRISDFHEMRHQILNASDPSDFDDDLLQKYLC